MAMADSLPQPSQAEDPRTVTQQIMYPAADKPLHRIRPDLFGTVIPAEHGTLVRWAVPAGQPETPLHSHIEFEQITVLLEGRIRTRVGDEVFVLGPGDLIRIARGAQHGNTTALDGRDAMVLDIFMPPRPQYLDAAQAEAS
jgi:quercetin dioxygenase-like cupin family protein